MRASSAVGIAAGLALGIGGVLLWSKGRERRLPNGAPTSTPTAPALQPTERGSGTSNPVYHAWSYETGGWVYAGRFNHPMDALSTVDDASQSNWYYILSRDEQILGARVPSAKRSFRYSAWSALADGGWSPLAEHESEWFVAGDITLATAGSSARAFILRRDW